MLLSLYAGCGGLDLGFERAGFRVGLAYDLRESAVRSWNRNRDGAGRGRVADLREVGIADMDRHHGGRFAPAGVVGGPPCQPFSRASRTRPPGDPRSAAVRRFFTLALCLHRRRGPLRFILMENVPELAGFRDGRLLGREVERLEGSGFDVRAFVADAAAHAVPQRRRRLFVLAFPKAGRAMERFSPPIGGGPRRTVADAIGRLPQPALFAAGMDRDAIPFHENHWCMAPRSRKFFDGTLAEGQTSARSFKVLAWDRPSVAVSYGHREVHVHPTGTRRLSVFEAMRLQGFPDDFVLEGTLSAQIDQVSEAVPPPLALAVARSIRSALAPP